MSDELKDLGKLIDCSEKDFMDYCTKQNLGYLMSLKQLMYVTYNQVYGMTEDLVEKGESMSEEERKDEKFVKTLEGLHAKMMVMDLKYMILDELIKDRSSRSLDKS